MEQSEVVRMAIDAGLTCYGGSQQSSGQHSWHAYTPHIERFASLVAAAEREKCCRACEEVADNAWSKSEVRFAESTIAAIRALD